MTTGRRTVPRIGQVPGGLIAASVHISMVLISIIQSILVMLMALFGVTGKVIIILSSSQR